MWFGMWRSRREGFDTQQAQVSTHLDVRYQGQSYELSVPFTPRFRHDFHREHVKAYGYADAKRPIEIVNLRLRLVIRTPKSNWSARKSLPRRETQQALVKTKAVWFGGKPHPTAIYERSRLTAGNRMRGPAVIVEYSATTVVPPDFDCKVDQQLNLILEKKR